MKYCLIAFLFAGMVASGQTNPKYNKSLADSLGSDEYGMKRYVLVILKTGPNKPDSQSVVDSLFRGALVQYWQDGARRKAGSCRAVERK
jgi:hypothetical protein